MRYAHVNDVPGYSTPIRLSVSPVLKSPSMPEREHFFDPWLTVDSGLIDAIAGNLEHAVLHDPAPRQRKRKERDLENLQRIVKTIAANLAYAVIAGFDPPVVAVPLAKPKEKQSRYEPQGFRQLPLVLERLQTGGLLELNKSRERGRASTIKPTAQFTNLLLGIRKKGFKAFHRADGEQVIILSRAETDHATGTRIADWIDYADTASTHRYQEEMERINKVLAAADLRHEGSDSEIDTQRRNLRRVFNIPSWLSANRIRFDLGGRLYGGWWQNLKESDRAFIRIDGESVADLDFKSMFPRLAYIHARKPTPPGDPYALPGFDGYRNGVKRTFNAMLFRRGKLTRVPRGSRDLLPENCTGEKIRAAILNHHPLLKPLFERGIGFELMFLESRILIAVLLRLIDLGITALPMHDGLMVAESKARTASRVMGDVSEELTGHRLPVSRK